MLSSSGIYAITNLVNGKRYVGSAVNLSRRWTEHRTKLNANRHHSVKLQRAWNKYGAGVFTFTVLELVEKPGLRAREQHWIDALRPTFKTEYNVLSIAGSALGYTHSCDARLKIGMAQKGKIVSETTREKIRIARARQVFTEETRRKLSAIRKGRKRPPEVGAKVSAAQKGKKKNITAEGWAAIGRKVSAANKGRIVSAETGRKISAAKKGKPLSAEHRIKLAAIHRAWRERNPPPVRTYKFSAAAREKMSIAAKHRFSTHPPTRDSNGRVMSSTKEGRSEERPSMSPS